MVPIGPRGGRPGVSPGMRTPPEEDDEGLHVVAEDHLGDTRGLARALHLEHELLGHLRATGDVLDRGQGDAEAEFRADRNR